MAVAVADRLTNRGVAEAADNQPLISGQTNFNTQTTTVARLSGTGDLFSVVDTSGAGAVRGQGTAARYGVFGVSDAGIGLAASSQSGPGAFLDSVSGVGFQGRSVSSVGVIGSTNNNAVLSQGQAPSNAYAAQFVGGHGVFIDGDLQVTGQKSAAVEGSDGELRRVFCVESPEAFFEDFGAADLVNGSATVKLDQDFNDLVDGTRYHVFLTPYADCKGLFVSRRGPNAFDVQELGNGKGSLRFAYRIVAPRGDGPKLRLPKTKRPDLQSIQDQGSKFDQLVREVRGRGPK
jgi:hypothetical protein